jgi:UDP-GlcNAc:undecaprenyl-phosphate GlcNAc-1-phosphate transferase
MVASQFTIFVAAFVAAVFFTECARRIALRIGLVDWPDGARKMHAEPTPLGGGVAILAAMFAGLLVAAISPNLASHFWQGVDRQLIGLVAAVFFLCIVGLLDDALRLRARQKLLGQGIACLLVMSTGLLIDRISLFGFEFDLGLAAWPITIFWLLGAINSVNLIDGADGLAATVGIILAATIACMAYMSGHIVETVLALALAGSLMGFLLFNFPPASIFLGDAGSMVVGLIAGTLALRGALKTPTAFAMAAPLALWAVPALDTISAVVRRRLTGRSLAATDRAHLHHVLLRRGQSNRQLLVTVAILCLITSLGALASLRFANEWFAIGSVVLMVALLLGTRTFGEAELWLIANSVVNLGRSMSTPLGRAGSDLSTAVQLQGSLNWEPFWNLIRSASDDLQLSEIFFNINLPWLHESFHGSWKSSSVGSAEEKWRLDLPLFVEGRSVGVLKLAGRAEIESLSDRGAKLAIWIARIDQGLHAVLSENETAITGQLKEPIAPPRRNPVEATPFEFRAPPPSPN